MNKSLSYKQQLLVRTFWTILLLFIAYYLYRAFYYRFLKEGLGPTFWNKQFWYLFHIVAAVPILLIGPLQFWVWFRKHHMKWHRLLGKVYVIGSLLGGVSALYLAITIQYPESVIPLSISSTLWLFTTAAAWVTIKNKNVQAHRLFMIRSYTLALSFIFIRILSDLAENYGFIGFISNSEARDATREWASWIVPLLFVEIVFAWLPSIRQKKVSKTYTGKAAQTIEL
jgi:uncharacterized membrane protein